MTSNDFFKIDSIDVTSDGKLNSRRVYINIGIVDDKGEVILKSVPYDAISRDVEYMKNFLASKESFWNRLIKCRLVSANDYPDKIYGSAGIADIDIWLTPRSYGTSDKFAFTYSPITSRYDYFWLNEKQMMTLCQKVVDIQDYRALQAS